MITIPLQDYILFRTDSATATATQDSECWLDLAGYQDLVAFLEVKEWSGATSIQLSYQTAPTKDDALFVNMTTAVTLVTGLTTTTMLKASASVPLARWVRWRLAGTTISGSWGAMFRVWLACNLSGRRGRVPLPVESRNRMLASEPSVPITTSIVRNAYNQFPGGGTGGSTGGGNGSGGVDPTRGDATSGGIAGA